MLIPVTRVVQFGTSFEVLEDQGYRIQKSARVRTRDRKLSASP
jgi:hypothetical protein